LKKKSFGERIKSLAKGFDSFAERIGFPWLDSVICSAQRVPISPAKGRCLGMVCRKLKWIEQVGVEEIGSVEKRNLFSPSQLQREREEESSYG
jgi:hypothetical protein